MIRESVEATVSYATPERGHLSVMAQEAIDALEPRPGGVYVDATFGDGGHSRAILQRIGSQGRLFALDRDRTAVQRSRALVCDYPEQLTVVHTPFSRLKEVLDQYGVATVQGVLFDLGVSSRQLDEPDRGFSFQADGPLDMRMDQPCMEQPMEKLVTAATIVNTFGREALADIFFHFGEERHARRIAQAIVLDRQKQPFTTTRQLASLLERITPRKRESRKFSGKTIHPATRVFQALRMAVNREMEELQTGLAGALERLAHGGKMAVISFHSLEDRMVKQTFRQTLHPPSSPLGPAALVQPVERAVCFRLVTRKPLFAKAEEVQHNPRARSARMRVIERLPAPLMHDKGSKRKTLCNR